MSVFKSLEYRLSSVKKLRRNESLLGEIMALAIFMGVNLELEEYIVL